MERRLLFILSLLLPTLLMANPVGKEQAQEKALSFVNGRSAAKARGPKAASNLSLVMSQDCYHVFNIGTGDGFVIVSGDDCAPDILGYADSGTIDPQSMPDNMKAWLQGYADQIEWMKAHGVKADKSFTTRAAKSSISPLLTSEWNQGEPYNNECPNFVNGARSVTGCVATAMAQIMYYHKWPAKTIQEIPSYQFASGYTGGPLTVSAISANTEFDWSNMTPYYDDSSNDAKKAAVATLMKVCGASVQMDYADAINGGSSASTSKVANALKIYFDYNGTAQNLSRNNFSYSQWIDIIYTELAADRPVLIGGQSTGGGHAFVCDGFDEDDLFHINWGWGGMSDGYFRISVLAPDEQGAGGSTTSDGYRMWQDITVGIQKNIGTTEPIYTVPTATNPTLVADGDITLSSASPKTGEEVDITVAIKNTGSEDYHGDITFALRSGSTIQEKLGGLSTDIAAGATKTITITATPSTAGTFNIAVMKGYFEYATVLKEKEVTIGTGVSVETSSNVDLTFALNVNNKNEDSKYILGNSAKVTLSVTNSSTTNFKGQIGVLMHYTYTEGSITYTGYNSSSYTGYTVPASKTSTINFQFDDLKDGREYYFSAYYFKESTQVDYNDALDNHYTAKPAITIYYRDGTSKLAMAEASYTSDDFHKVAAVDLRGQSVVTSISGCNINTLFFFDEDATIPSSISSRNIIKGSTAENIELWAGYGFYVPFDFIAKNITYNNSKFNTTDGTGKGWNTICLPFDVASVSADGNAIDWFKTSSDSGKDFWVQAFVSDAADVVNFGYTTEMKAYTPYILTFPGNKWSSHDLSGKKITFTGSNAPIKSSAKAVVTGSNIKFVGVINNVSADKAYVLNSTGSKFEVTTNYNAWPFTAYFAQIATFSSPTAALAITINEGETVGITSIKGPQDNSTTIYDLHGMKVGTVDQLNTLPKGIYIINGKKIIK